MPFDIGEPFQKSPSISKTKTPKTPGTGGMLAQKAQPTRSIPNPGLVGSSSLPGFAPGASETRAAPPWTLPTALVTPPVQEPQPYPTGGGVLNQQHPIFQSLGQAPTGYDNSAAMDLNTAAGAAMPPNPTAQAELQAHANAAGAQKILDLYNTIPSPTFTPYAPAPLPTHTQAEIPERNDSHPNTLALGITALAGLLSPQHAGAIASVPYQVADQQDNKDYADDLQKYGMQQKQNDINYNDALAQSNQKASTDQINRAGQADLASQIRALIALKAQPSADVASNTVLSQGLPQIGTDQAAYLQQQNASKYGMLNNDLANQANDNAFRQTILNNGNINTENNRKESNFEFDQNLKQGQNQFGFNVHQGNFGNSLQVKKLNMEAEGQNYERQMQQAQLMVKVQQMSIDPDNSINAAVDKDAQVQAAQKVAQNAQEAVTKLTMGQGEHVSGSQGKVTIDNTPVIALLRQRATDLSNQYQNMRNLSFNRYAAMKGLKPLELNPDGSPKPLPKATFDVGTPGSGPTVNYVK